MPSAQESNQRTAGAAHGHRTLAAYQLLEHAWLQQQGLCLCHHLFSRLTCSISGHLKDVFSVPLQYPVHKPVEGTRLLCVQ